MKKRLGPSDRLYPMPCPLVLSGTGDAASALAVAWVGIAGSTPPSIVMALRETRHTLALIHECGEFTVNVPPTSLAAEVDFLGIVGGRDRDKMTESGLTLVPSAMVAPPIIEECPYNMECRLTHEIELGSYHLVVGEVVETHADETVLDETGAKVDVGALDPLVYIAGSREYRGLGPKLADAFSVGRSLDRSGSTD